MSSISISFISSSKGQTGSIRVPIIDRATLDVRIQDFARVRRNRVSWLLESSWAVGRQLFQDGSREVFSCPIGARQAADSVAFSLAGELSLFCNGPDQRGVIFCFLPDSNIDVISSSSTLEEGICLPGFHEAPFFSFSMNRVSCLIGENGWIAKDEKGDLSLKGIEFTFVRRSSSKGLFLFCRTTEEAFPFPEKPIQAQSYIKVHCFSSWKNFSFCVRIPVLTEYELEKRIKEACHARGQIMGTNLTDTECLDQQQLFPPFPRIFDFPPGMGIQIPSGEAFGGEVLCSYREESCFQIAFLPHSFERGETLPIKAFRVFPIWQTGYQAYSQSQLPGGKIHILSSRHVRLLPCSDKEYRMQGACLNFLCTAAKGLWGLFVSANREEVVSATASSVDSVPMPSSRSTGGSPSPPLQQLISVPYFIESRSQVPKIFEIPLLDPSTLEACIQGSNCFGRAYEYASKDGEKIVCKILLNSSPNELFFFPGPLTEQELICNLKLFSSDIGKRGFSLWYFPPNSGSRTKNNLIKRKDVFSLQKSNQAKCFAIPHNRITCLISEDGWFLSSSSNKLSLRGLSLQFIQKTKSVGLFCQSKEEDLSHPERPIVMGGVVRKAHANYKNYVQIDCSSSYKGFFFQIRLPVLNIEELQNEIKMAIDLRKEATEKQVHALTVSRWEHKEDLFKKEDYLSISFPPGMEVDVPFGGCLGGDLFLAFDGTSFQILLISDAFRTKKEEMSNRRGSRRPFLRPSKGSFHKVICSSNKLYLFKSPDIKLLKKSRREYCIEGARLQLMTILKRSLWGITISRASDIAPIDPHDASHSGSNEEDACRERLSRKRKLFLSDNEPNTASRDLVPSEEGASTSTFSDTDAARVLLELSRSHKVEQRMPLQSTLEEVLLAQEGSTCHDG
ncbi:hypothetical protein [Candidatus Similichlamydia laticola]|uniref:hypothetical protein n=1 Tax=Candidatus Similichlamydia laticola TaxID=2170265 RepID=UPI000DF73599|nr:hypothetical protein [Candidatus Similichlamydia laticola]